MNGRFSLKAIGELPAFHIELETQLRMGESFLRVQEHQESPDFSGRFFSKAEYKEWYKTQKEGEYWSHWRGYNIDVNMAREFLHRSEDLDEYEKFMYHALSLIQSFMPIWAMLIGTCTENPIKLDHEISHILWKCDLKYKSVCSEIINSNLYQR